MQRINLLTAIALTAFIALSCTQALAQTSEAAEFKKRIFAQIATGQRTQPVENIEVEALPAASPAVLQVGILDVLERQKKALLGTWNLIVTFSDGTQVKSTLSVFPGHIDNEGAVIHSAEASLLLPNPTLSEQGAWRHNGGLQFTASYRGYAVDERFERPAGQIGFRHAITLNTDQETFTGRAVFEVVDTSGQVLFSDNVQTRGVRQHAVAP